MMWRLAWRSLLTRPVRAAVLAAGFGFGVAVMVELLGVGHVILEQAHAPALSGGGDLVVYGPFGSVPSARFVMSSINAHADLAHRVKAVSPSMHARLFLMTADGAVPISATGGIPSLERAVGDEEIAGIPAWTDAPGDERWARPEPADMLRAMDRFHPVPDVPARARSWAEWLYFNGRSHDGRTRLYVTFMVGPRGSSSGLRSAGVRLQLERDGRSSAYSAQGEIDEASLLASAPDMEIAGNRVHLEGLRYRITLALRADGTPSSGSSRDDRLQGEIVLDAAPRRSLPPATIRGAGGWVSGYVVPALTGNLRGELQVGREALTIDAVGYHDHNWGFWEGVSWQWGQVAHDDTSIVFGRVFPPPDVADPARIPGFLAVLGPDGPRGFSTNVTIDDTRSGHVDVRAIGTALDLHLAFAADESVRTPMRLTRVPGGTPLDFLQLGGTYRATGTVDDQSIEFTARGSAETFEGRLAQPEVDRDGHDH
jgi:hypothetical protein